jgi:anti-anti-sigma regulatory factor
MPETKREVVLKVDGWVSGSDVALLEEEGTRLLRESERLVLDLKGVRFIDRDGIDLLKRWAGDRLVLHGASPFLHVLLKEHGLA